MVSTTVDLNAKIPNNVGLSDDVKLQRALESWLPNYLEWWNDMGPSDFADKPVFLRTAVSVESDGWAHYDYVKMPDYRWGIFLNPREEAESTIRCGDDAGKPAWHEIPGEHRNALRRIIVTQADTEPASVEQQRLLGHTAPSLYDMRNLFQVNVEEGRHLWAMVYLLHKYFGRDGRDEAEELLERRSGDPDKPRILGAFNQPCDHWLSFFAFTMFTDRDGKYQLAALAHSGFDPLSRTTEFMLTEEAHHLFVGETGMDRIIKRSPSSSASTRTATSAARAASTSTSSSARSTTGSPTASTCSAARSRPTPPTSSPRASRAATARTATRSTRPSPAPTACPSSTTASSASATSRCATP
jgi:benzoyl-CoA 2,3-dioxygenase component B